MSFKDGRIGVGKDPIFPLDISGSCRIDGDLILGGRFSDSQGNPIQLGSGSGATSTPDQAQYGLPSWEGGTISTQGLGVFKGKMTANSIYISGDNTLPASVTGVNNTTLGVSAGLNLTSGVDNVMIGFQAGFYTADKEKNVYIGQWAGTNKNKSYNVLIGYSSGANCDSDFNVAVGMDSLKSTNEGYNIALGHSALRGHASYLGIKGSIGIGYKAGFAQGNSDYNIWMGHQAGPQTASSTAGTGNNNICIGDRPGYSLTTGNQNILMGVQSGFVINTGYDNIMLGYQAGVNTTSGLRNVYIGMQAGYSNVAGQNSVCIGTAAGLWKTGASKIVAIGYEALNHADGGAQCVAIGAYAMRGATGNNYDCVAIGYECMRSITSGVYNVAVGRSAGQALTSGSSNTFIGDQAGKGITTTSNNTIIGKWAGYNSGTSAAQCTFVGYHCGYNVNQAWNVALGYQALYNQCGNFNIAIGDTALYGNGSQAGRANNVAIGYRALYFAGACYSNVAVGYQAGESVSSGNSNIYVGYQAGKYCTTGLNNVIMGSQAFGGGASPNVTGGDNVMIGHYAGRTGVGAAQNVCVGDSAGNSITSCSGCVYIGYDAGGNATTGVDNVAIGRYAMRTGTVVGHYNVMMGYFCGYILAGGSNNVGIGNAACRHLQSGYGNTCVGEGSGFKISSGFNNQCFGRYAGYWCNTGNANICIGFSAGPKDTGGGQLNNRLYIGNIDHANSRGIDSYVYGDMTPGSEKWCFNANVGIGTTTLASSSSGNIKLDVHENGTTGWRGTGVFGNQNQKVIIGVYSNVATIGGHNQALTAWTDLCLGFGNVGIGTTSPDHPLHVDGYTHNDFGAVSWKGFSSTDTSWKYSSYGGNNSISIKAQFGLWCLNIFMNSDERIKENIVDVSDNLALQMVRNIPCRYYEYKDKLNRGIEKTIGFIAQEVKEVLPMAVSLQKNIIPNEMRNLKDLIWNDTTLYTDLSDCSGIKYRFYVSNDVSGNDEIQKDIVGNPDNTFTFDSSYNNVFCYGKEVDDFHTLDKNKLFALNFSATQELDRKVTALETVGNPDQNLKILDLYKENEALKARLAKLEAFLGI